MNLSFYINNNHLTLMKVKRISIFSSVNLRKTLNNLSPQIHSLLIIHSKYMKTIFFMILMFMLIIYKVMKIYLMVLYRLNIQVNFFYKSFLFPK